MYSHRMISCPYDSSVPIQRVISTENEGIPPTFKTAEADLVAYYQVLSERKPIKCAFTNKEFAAVNAPKTVILDVSL